MNQKKKAISKSSRTDPKQAKSSTPKSKSAPKTIIKTVIGVAIVVAIIATITWFTLPTISLKLASSNSGVDASIPYSMPDGYHLQIPISAKENKVIMTYVNSSNNTTITITQEKSLWDSQSVKNMVDKKSNGKYLTVSDRGITIYTFNGNAAWVNRGIFYQISSDNRLSSNTLVDIAGSL